MDKLLLSYRDNTMKVILGIMTVTIALLVCDLPLLASLVACCWPALAIAYGLRRHYVVKTQLDLLMQITYETKRVVRRSMARKLNVRYSFLCREHNPAMYRRVCIKNGFSVRQSATPMYADTYHRVFVNGNPNIYITLNRNIYIRDIDIEL